MASNDGSTDTTTGQEEAKREEHQPEETEAKEAFKAPLEPRMSVASVHDAISNNLINFET